MLQPAFEPYEGSQVPCPTTPDNRPFKRRRTASPASTTRPVTEPLPEDGLRKNEPVTPQQRFRPASGVDRDGQRTPSPPVPGSTREMAIETELTPGNIARIGFDVTLSPRRAPHLDRQAKRAQDSLYTRAFELALDTVLEHEAFLFNSDEHKILSTYRACSYEARYLYVRLFLRKRGAWFRQERIGYESDISDVSRACALLSACRLMDTDDDLTLDELARHLSVDELRMLAKELNFRSTAATKDKLVEGLLSVGNSQLGIAAAFTKTSNSNVSNSQGGQLRNKTAEVTLRVRAILGPLIRLSEIPVELFHRLHLVFYRSAEYDEKSLTTLILARISKRNFPEYDVDRQADVFRSREDLIEYEAALKLKAEVDFIMEMHTTEEGLCRVMEVFELVYERWQAAVISEQEAIETNPQTSSTYYSRRFTAPWIWTRLIFKAAAVLARRHEYAREHELLSTLLAQKVYRLGRRGEWYDRKALIEQHYNPSMHNGGSERDRRNSKRVALETCMTALRDPDTHQIHHDVLQRRIVRIERDLRLPVRERHNFSHVALRRAKESYVYGERLDDRLVGKHSVWRSRHSGEECSVERLALEAYQEQGYLGFHSENSIVTTLFAMLFFDILFLPVHGVFQTPFQTAPLDLATDAFFPARASHIHHRLAEIDNGAAPHILSQVDAAHRERKTWCVGLQWDYALADLLALVECLGATPLSRIMRLFAEEYGHRVGGVGDLCLWRPASDHHPEAEAMFVEVKGPGDRLSETQLAWLDQMSLCGIRVELCHVREQSPNDIDGKNKGVKHEVPNLAQTSGVSYIKPEPTPKLVRASSTASTMSTGKSVGRAGKGPGLVKRESSSGSQR
ncbi:hypothetical protein PYCC9005_000703 [Savitreella phatthalungensis]